MNTRYSRFGGGRKLLHSKSVEVGLSPAANASSDEEVMYKGFDDSGLSTKKLQRRSCLVIGEHTMTEYPQSSESYLLSLLKSTLWSESISPPPPGENGVRTHGDSHAGHNTDALTLHDFARLYHSKLPVTVHMMSDTVPGNTPPPQPPPPAVDVLSMTDAPVVVCIYKDFQLFHVPLDAEMRFAPLYDPCDDLGVALLGMVFYGVTSIVHSNPMPKVLCARSRWKTYDTSVQVGEILVVKEMHVKGGQVRGLSMFSMSTRTDKILPLKCQLQLTTQPKYLFLPLSDIAMHVPNAFPCKACVLENAVGGAPPVGAVDCVVTLNEVTRATVLTCSVPGEGKPTVVCTVPVALPDVRVVVSTAMSHMPASEGCGQASCSNGRGQAEAEEVWEYIEDLVQPTPVPVDDSHDKQAGTIAPMLAAGRSQSNLKQAVGIYSDYEDMDMKAEDVPDQVIIAKPAPGASTPAQGHKDSKRVAKRSQDYEDIDDILNRAHPQTVGTTVTDSNVQGDPAPRQRAYNCVKRVDKDYEDIEEEDVFLADVAPRQRAYNCARRVDKDYENIDKEDVFLADVPTETSATPHSRHGLAGDSKSTAQRKPFTETTELGGRDGLKGCGHFARDCMQVDNAPDEVMARGGEGTCDKPLGWIYMSSNDDEATNFDAECGGDSGFERCNSSELREDDDYFDTEQTRQGYNADQREEMMVRW